MLENSKAQSAFENNGYLLVKNTIDKSLTDFLSEYCLKDEIINYSPDMKQVLGAHSSYADPVMETLMIRLQSTIEQKLGLELYPTYSYYRVYRKNNELKPHKDRHSCEISATLCIGNSYTYDGFQWPIYMEDVPVNMEPGDMVIYRGMDLNHYRLPMKGKNDDWHIQAFLHYVDKNGPCKDFKFDKRKGIGLYRKI